MITLPLTDNAALLPHADGWLWIPANLPIRVRPGDLDLTVAEWLAANHTEQLTPGEHTGC